MDESNKSGQVNLGIDLEEDGEKNQKDKRGSGGSPTEVEPPGEKLAGSSDGRVPVVQRKQREIAEPDGPRFGVFEDLAFEPTPYSTAVDKISTLLGKAASSCGMKSLPMGFLAKLLGLILFNAYWGYCIWYFHSSGQEDIDWCNGIGLLHIITSVVYIYNIVVRGIIPGKILF